MTEFTYTPWFDVQENALPIRKGVYEGSAVGIPGKGGTLQHGYYSWDGRRWVAWGKSPYEVMDGISFQPRYWRGIIPDANYPFDQIEPNGFVTFFGVLARDGASDRIIVRRLLQLENELELEFIREQGRLDPEEYKCTMRREGNEFFASVRLKVCGYVSESPIEIRVISMSETRKGNELEVLLSLKKSQLLFFKGTLSESGSVLGQSLR